MKTLRERLNEEFPAIYCYDEVSDEYVEVTPQVLTFIEESVTLATREVKRENDRNLLKYSARIPKEILTKLLSTLDTSEEKQ